MRLLEMHVPKQVASSKLKKRGNNLLMNIVKRRKAHHPMSEADVLKEISKLCAKKVAFDEIDDRAGLERYSLAELAQVLYCKIFIKTKIGCLFARIGAQKYRAQAHCEFGLGFEKGVLRVI